MSKSKKPKSCPSTMGDKQAAGLVAALSAFANAPAPGARDLPIVQGIKRGGGFMTSQENAIVEVGMNLAASKRVFRFGGRVVFESKTICQRKSLVTLVENMTVTAGAEDILANLVVCKDADGQFQIPRALANLVLRSEVLPPSLPEIRTYFKLSTYDKDWVLRQPGWHPDLGMMIHGPSIEPVPWKAPAAGCPATKRLPPHLYRLLGEFCFRTDGDLANALAFLLTAMSADRYIARGKPVALIDANQPGLGKTLLARIASILRDGVEADILQFTTQEEELQKRMGAYLMAESGTVLILDNAKVPAGNAVSSPALEAWVSGPRLSFRKLGTSEMVSRPNNLLFVLTMNDTRASDDLLSRGLPIRLAFEGAAASRKFTGDAVRYAVENRLEILGELAGMIDFWIQKGRVPGVAGHRFAQWASDIGGILAACGIPEFLANVAEATSEFSAAGDELESLAEFVVRRGGPGLQSTATPSKLNGLKAAEWVPIFEEVCILEDELRLCNRAKSKSQKVGKFFSPLVGRTVEVFDGKKTVAATLCSVGKRAREKVYYFSLASGTGESTPAAGVEEKPVQKIQELILELPVPTLSPTTTEAAGNAEQW